MEDSDSKDWRQLYQAALFETDLSKLPARIEAASEAVQEKLRDLIGAREDSRHREALLDAMRTLQALRREKR